MKHNRHSQNRHHTVAGAPTATVASDLAQGAIAFTPSPDEVARRAYFTYVNDGSRPGRDVQHWLDAESQLIAERNLTRTHGFHNQT